MLLAGNGLWMLVWLCMLLSPRAAITPPDDDIPTETKSLAGYIRVGAGASGQKCKNGRHCIREAGCVQNQCVCPPHRPKGDGYIACVKEDEHLCIASLDPDVVSFAGSRAKVSLPCRHRLTYFITRNTASDPGQGFPLCAIEVFAISSVTDYGAFYQKGFDVSIKLGDRQRGDFISLDIKKVGILDGDLYQYIVGTDHSHSPFGGPLHEEWNGVSLECYFDPVDNFAVVWVPECNAGVKFRPYNYTKEEDVQVFKPGIVIKAPADAIFERKFGGFPGSLCAHPDDDPDVYKDLAKERKLRGTTAALTYEMLIVGVSQEGAQGDFDELCTEADEIIAHCWNREESIDACNRILSHKPTRKCLLEKKFNIMSTFISCLEFFCFNEKLGCERFTSQLSQCQKTHKFLADVSCENAQPRVTFNNDES